MHAVRSALLVGLLLSISLAGCAGATGPSPSATPTEPPPTQVPGGELPGGSPTPSDGSGGSGGSGGTIGGGGSDPGGGGNGGGGAIPGEPGPDGFVTPNPGGTIDPHPVAIEALEVEVDGRHVTVVASWTSGVAPCYVLDTVAVKRDGNEFTIALTEGAGAADVMCIEIAQEKRTRVDLGELDPGDYVAAAQEETAPAIPFTVH